MYSSGFQDVPTFPGDSEPPPPALGNIMDDSDFGFGIVYLIENAQQFWSGAYLLSLSLSLLSLAKSAPVELEDILHLPTDPSLPCLDSTLKRFTSLCASYHGTPFHNRRVPHQSLIPNMQ